MSDHKIEVWNDIVYAIKHGLKNWTMDIECRWLPPGAGNEIIVKDLEFKGIKNAISNYHFALDKRENGDLATHHAISMIQNILNMNWKQGEELNRRTKEKEK